MVGRSSLPPILIILASAIGAIAAEPVPFTVPAGFVAEKVAGPPLVQHPMFACFDDGGRLFVSDSGGKNLKAEDLLRELPSCIRVLEAANPRGQFEKSSIFADKMSFPMGCLWHDGAVYVCSPPSLWRLRDTKGTGIADERVELVTKFGFIGNAADIHGPWLGPDGRLYWTDGRHGHEIKKPDGSIQTKGKAARIFRSKLDGSEVEVICGGGMDDPVQMAFTEEGEPFAVVDIFESRPARMDALIYCIDGGVFPYYEAVLGEFKRTGPLLPAISELGWVAPSGLMRYRGAAFGKEYTDNLFSTQFNTHKVVRHILQREGASFKTKDEDFLVSTDPDFHPTSLLEDADGSMLVIDTGGWFRIGCPTSQIAKPEIKGGIYRIRKKNAPMVDDPRGLRIEWTKLTPAQMIAFLDDSRWVVRDRAVEELAKAKGNAIPDLAKAIDSSSVQIRRGALWALTRMRIYEARDLANRALSDRDASVRLCAARSAGIHRDSDAVARLCELVTHDPDQAVRREAATALGRIKDWKAEERLVEALQQPTDRLLEHAIIYALMEIGPPIGPNLTDESPAKVRRAILIARDQADPKLRYEDVLPSLLANDPDLQQAAWQIVLRHSNWLSRAIELIRDDLHRVAINPSRRDGIRDALARSAATSAVETLITSALEDHKTSLAGRLLLLEAIDAAPVAKLPRPWIDALKAQLGQNQPQLIRQAMATIRARSLTDCDGALEEFIKRSDAQPDLRLAALAIVAPRWKQLPDALFGEALSQFKGDASTGLRLTAADALGKSPLNEKQQLALAAALPQCSALELPRLLDAFQRSSSPSVGRELVANLAKSPGIANLSPADLREALKSFPAEIRTAAEPLFKKLAVDDAALRQKLADLDGVWKTGDAARGKQVFFGKKALCAACHTAQGQGEHIGPELTKIGSIRTEKDLLESIVIPSASIARGFESCVVHTTGGKSASGLIRRETADAIYLITSDRVQVRIPRSRIESLEASRTSVMPQGLEAQMSRQELGDLIAFLKALR